MNSGLVITIGINHLDEQHYSGWKGFLKCCENDSILMSKILDSVGFDVTNIKTQEATREKVLQKLYLASEQLKSGDILVVYYSGHGGQLLDENRDEWDDCLDETWCLFNGQLLDDELYELWSKFKEDVRILIISDSCHSGTIVKKFSYELNNDTKIMPFDVSECVYGENKDFYNKILAGKKNESK